VTAVTEMRFLAGQAQRRMRSERLTDFWNYGRAGVSSLSLGRRGTAIR
jgi:hypothetical protein